VSGSDALHKYRPAQRQEVKLQPGLGPGPGLDISGEIRTQSGGKARRAEFRMSLGGMVQQLLIVENNGKSWVLMNGKATPV
jgi:hypothetical protein